MTFIRLSSAFCSLSDETSSQRQHVVPVVMVGQLRVHVSKVSERDLDDLVLITPHGQLST
jgi:hypothetical protein